MELTTPYDNIPVNLDGPNMTDYVEVTGTFQLTVPEFFNYGFDVVDRWAADRTKLAMVWADKTATDIRKYSFHDLKVLSNKWANALREKGVKKGDTLFVMIPRRIEWYAVMLGCFKLGAVPMPAANILVPHDIEYRITQADAVGAVVFHDHAFKVDEIAANCPTLKHRIAVGEEPAKGETTSPNAVEGWDDFHGLMHAASGKLSREDIEATRADDILLIYFTSGTTKMPKMVPHTQASYGIGHIITAKFWQDLKPTDLHWTLSDTGWAKAAWGKLFGQWQVGAAVMVHDQTGKFDAGRHLQLIEDCGVTTFCAPPTAYRMLILDEGFKTGKYDLSGLRHSCAAGEPLNPEVIRAWQEATGTTIYDGFGQTETVNLIANFPCNPIKFGSMGKPTPGFDVRLLDDDGNEAPVDEEGHIAVRVRPTPPVGLLKEYWRDEDATKVAFQGDWYYTGDKAYKDKEGYFWFVGRSDDVIKASGYRIGPFEVESALQSHEAVAESAVVGSPDELRGTIVKAFIVLAPGFQASDDLVKELQDHVKQETAPYKYPREIEFMEELPKTVSGKIKRAVLRKIERDKKGQG